MSNLVPVQDIERMALAVAKSGLFGIKTPEQGVALMLIAQAEGMHPAIAARDFHVIQGRPALKADAMLARFQQAGGKVSWDVYTDAEVTGTFSHPNGGTLSVTWTFEQARRIGLTGKDNWKNYPRAMLRARVISEGIRSVYPGCVVGVYTPEEVQDFDSKAPPEVKNMGAVEVVEIADTSTKAWQLYAPNLKEPHSGHDLAEEWIEAYGKLVYRLMQSKSLDAEAKQSKLNDLMAANQAVIDRMPNIEKVRLYGVIAENGGSVPVPAREGKQANYHKHGIKEKSNEAEV